jgi:hypothetical protein
MLLGGSYEGGLWFFVRLVRQSLGDLICVVFLFSIFCQIEGWCQEQWIYVTKCKQKLGLLWKFNVVLGLCGMKTLRRIRKASGFKRERSERSDPLETSSLSLMKKVVT